MFCISFVYLLIICTLHAKFKKVHACEAAVGAGQNAHLLQLTTGTSFEISYIPILSVMTPHYHRLYQISSLEANLSSEDRLRFCRQKPPSQVYIHQN